MSEDRENKVIEEEAFLAEESGRIRKWQIVLLALLVVLLLILGTLFLFRVQTVTVSGNYHNTDAEVRELVMQGPLAFNSLYLKARNNNRKIGGETFIDAIDVQMQGLHDIQIVVREKDLVGYVKHEDLYWYFDREGVVRIVSEKDESAYAAQMAAKDAQAEDGTAEEVVAAADEAAAGMLVSDFLWQMVFAEEISPEESIIAPVEVVDEEGEILAPIETEDAETVTAGEGEESAPEETPEEAEAEEPTGTSGLGVVTTAQTVGSYIPFVEGLEFSGVAVGEVLPVKNQNIFASLETLKVYVNKNKEMLPDHVTFDEYGNLFLTFMDAKVNLGSGNYVGRRLEQLGGIYSYIAGLSGTLHLENYDGSQERLIFTRDRA